MKKAGITFIIALLLANVAIADPKQDKRTIAFINAFTRHVTKNNKRHTQRIHTMDLAQAHLRLWQDWSKTHRWPQIALRDYSMTKVGKANASSVVRSSWYIYDDSALEVEADNNGRVGEFSTKYDMGPYEGHGFYLKPKQMDELQRLLRRLPPSRKVVKWSDVLLISGRSNGHWFVRMYSRTQKPKVIRQLLQMMSPKILNTRFRA